MIRQRAKRIIQYNGTSLTDADYSIGNLIWPAFLAEENRMPTNLSIDKGPPLSSKGFLPSPVALKGASMRPNV